MCVCVLFLWFNGLPSFRCSLMIVVTHSTARLRALSNCQHHVHSSAHSFSEEKRKEEKQKRGIRLIRTECKLNKPEKDKLQEGVEIENDDRYKLKKNKGERKSN